MFSRLYILLPACFLSGCVGTYCQDGGEGKYVDAAFPDIHTVPSRKEAQMSRTYHTPKQEAKKSQRDLEALEAEREGIQARDEALRDRAFGKEKD